ncbi:hypothetical protein ABIF64_000386 [Bradyrhizobium japonicum]|nr:hypothetical protein [Bradyrhizobium japonicum]MCP1793255.1 hypothetical protein [Bradyrhizobium japonicum]MCP1805688.1 hypothetical protein [Bradyrhizobium japonicum]MCP1814705.1 hypothetical protein [Bradyrhizobium japonicum]MCP1873866.1 hypothetical protein [Bradyrhizobium japonicum]
MSDDIPLAPFPYESLDPASELNLLSRKSPTP